MKSIPDVARDFDRIAGALAGSATERRLTDAERAVLEAVPPSARSALDAGCGDGLMARALTGRGLTVVAVDVAPLMIALARMRTASAARIDYRVADVMQTNTLGTYDAVVSVNMVHHLPLERILPRLSALVAPGGVLVIQDVVTRAGIRYLPINVVAAVVTRGRRLLRRDGEPRKVRELYDEHGRGETYLAPHAVRDALGPYLAGVRVIHHLGWRYTAIWSRAAAT